MLYLTLFACFGQAAEIGRTTSPVQDRRNEGCLAKRVDLALQVLFESPANQVAKFKDTDVGNLIVDEKPLLLTGEKTGVRQGVEVSGHVGLTRSGLFNELADVPGTSHESHNQPETHWLA